MQIISISIQFTNITASYLLDFDECALLLHHTALGFTTTGGANGEQGHQLALAHDELVSRTENRGSLINVVTMRQEVNTHHVVECLT